MRKGILIPGLAVALILPILLTANVFAYRYKYEARLAILDKYPVSNLQSGPVLDQEEFYGELLDPAANPSIAAIVKAAGAGKLDEAKTKWHEYFVKRDDAARLIEIPPKKPSELTKDDVDWTLAERGLKRGFEKSGYEYFFEGDIKWNYNPTYKNPKVPVNNEWVYQLNRHGWWPELAKAAIVTGDEKYAKELAYQIRSWITTQYPGVNTARPDYIDEGKAVLNYSTAFRNAGKDFSYNIKDKNGADLEGGTASWRSLEVGVRLMSSWMQTIYYFKGSKYFDADLCDLMIRSMIDQATWLVAPYHYSQWSNWGNTEAMGLLYAGSFLPEILTSREMREVAISRLTEAALYEQFLPDGSLNELSPSYHTGVTEKYNALIRAAKEGKIQARAIEDLKRVLESQYNAILAILAPNASLPTGNETGLDKLAGDDTEREYFATGAELLPHRQDFKWIATGGKEGKPPAINFYRLKNSGFITMRSGWNPTDDYLYFMTGPMGSGSYHSFENKLSIQLFSNGFPLLTSAGKDNYDKSPMRWYCANTRGSNSALVDGYGQARGAKTPMAVLRKPADFWYYQSAGGDITYAASKFDGPYGCAGYGDVLEKAALNVQHTRHVFYLKKNYFVIADDFTALDGKDHLYEVIYHTPIGWYAKNKPTVATKAEKTADGMYWLIGKAEATMKGVCTAAFTGEIVSGLNPANTDLTKATDGRGTERQMRGWLEGMIPTPTEIYKINGKNVTFFTVIAPMKKPADFTVNLTPGRKGVEIKFKTGETHRLALDVTAGGQPSISFETPKTKASFTAISNLDTLIDVNGGALPK